MSEKSIVYKSDSLSELLISLEYDITNLNVIDYRNKPMEIAITKDRDCNFVATVKGDMADPDLFTIKLDFTGDPDSDNGRITVEGFIDCDCDHTYRNGLGNEDARCPLCGKLGVDCPDADLDHVLEMLTYKELLSVQRTLGARGYFANTNSYYGALVIDYMDKVKEGLTDISA